MRFDLILILNRLLQNENFTFIHITDYQPRISAASSSSPNSALYSAPSFAFYSFFGSSFTTAGYTFYTHFCFFCPFWPLLLAAGFFSYFTSGALIGSLTSGLACTGTFYFYSSRLKFDSLFSMISLSKSSFLMSVVFFSIHFLFLANSSTSSCVTFVTFLSYLNKKSWFALSTTT